MRMILALRSGSSFRLLAGPGVAGSLARRTLRFRAGADVGAAIGTRAGTSTRRVSIRAVGRCLRSKTDAATDVALGRVPGSRPPMCRTRAEQSKLKASNVACFNSCICAFCMVIKPDANVSTQCDECSDAPEGKPLPRGGGSGPVRISKNRHLLIFCDVSCAQRNGSLCAFCASFCARLCIHPGMVTVCETSAWVPEDMSRLRPQSFARST